NILNGDIPEQISGQYSRQAIFDIMQSLSFKRDWNIFYRHHPYLPVSLFYTDKSVFKNRGQSPLVAISFNARVVFVHTKKRHVTAKVFSHLINQLIIRIKNCVTMRKDSFRNNSFYFCHLLNVVDAAKANMIGGYIGYNRHIAILKRKA